MNQYFQHLVRSASGLACMLLLAFNPVASAETFRVGPSAGIPGTACQFRTPQAAIDALPDDNQSHVIEMESGNYLGVDGTVEVDGRRIVIRTIYTAGSDCEVSGPGTAELRASGTSLEGGRTIVVRNEGQLTLERIFVTGNSRGAILVRDSRLELDSSAVANNSTPAGSSGAGIVIEGGNVFLFDSRMIENDAGANGGAVFCSRSNQQRAKFFADDETVFLSNSALNGGAIFQFRGCDLLVQGGTTFDSNRSFRDGGAIATDPLANGAEEENSLELLEIVGFFDNVADRDGGAISMAGHASFEGAAFSLKQFERNRAGRFGGAIDIANAAAEVRLRNAQFIANTARERGGAISVRGGRAELDSNCNGETVNENYCAVFDGNSVVNEGTLARRGGTLNLDSGELSVEGFAFRNSRGPVSLTEESGGVIAAVSNGTFLVSNSIVYDNTVGLSNITNLFQLNGGTSQFSFNTMVGTPAGSVILVKPGATAELVGNIIAENASGIVGNGEIGGTCNNVQLGSSPAPNDPKFVTTSAGRFRLAADSAMIDGALECRSSSLPAGYEFPARDLDGVLRREPGEAERELDLGAFEYRLDDDSLFRSGFEFVPDP